MFRILLLAGLIFASAHQGFARKVDFALEDALAVVIVQSDKVELGSQPCCQENPVKETKSTYCKSDCKGVIASGLVVLHKKSEAQDGALAVAHNSASVPLEPGPPKS